MSVNASILHFEKHLNATVCLGLTGHQGNKAENAAFFFCTVYSAQNPGCLKFNAVALSTRHPREDVFLKSRELQKMTNRAGSMPCSCLFPKAFFFFSFFKNNLVLFNLSSNLFHKQFHQIVQYYWERTGALYFVNMMWLGFICAHHSWKARQS